MIINFISSVKKCKKTYSVIKAAFPKTVAKTAVYNVVLHAQCPADTPFDNTRF